MKGNAQKSATVLDPVAPPVAPTAVEPGVRAPRDDVFEVERVEIKAGGRGLAVFYGSDDVEKYEVDLAGGGDGGKDFVEVEYPAVRASSTNRFGRVMDVQELARYVASYPCKIAVETRREGGKSARVRISLINRE